MLKTKTNADLSTNYVHIVKKDDVYVEDSLEYNAIQTLPEPVIEHSQEPEIKPTNILKIIKHKRKNRRRRRRKRKRKQKTH